MINSGASKFIIIAVLAAVAVTTVADLYSIEGDFVERRADWTEFGFVKGKFYYLYDSTDKDKCRLRFDYSLKYLNEGIVSSMYHYEDRAVYSMVGDDKCSGTNTNERPEPWWMDDTLYVKTDEEVGGMFWYDRKPGSIPVDQSGQVKRILMKQVSSPEDGYLGAIVFFDGRTVTFKNVKKTSRGYSDPIFSILEVCPRPTCPIYADIVFVLDSSGSVDNVEWAETVNFVNEVMALFTFGENAVQAAAVQFNGQDDGCRKTFLLKERDCVPEEYDRCVNKTRYKGDCTYPNRKDPIAPDLMMTVKAGADYGNGQTVSPNRDELMRQLNDTVRSDCAWPPNRKQCQAFSGYRGTCQALGLKLAMEVLDRSPRKEYNTKPSNVVIVVTDGEDKYPNMTRGNATLLKQEPYNAFLIEVGVGLECSYDERYLSSIASQMGSEGTGAYFNASDYTQIKVLADKLFRPLCESNFSTECGPECKGFCAAGECLCPDCDESDNVCRVVQCNVSGSFTRGCVEVPSVYEIPDDVCVNFTCDAEKVNPPSQKNGEWIAHYNFCEENKTAYPGTCRNFYCDAEYGGCQDEVNDTYCRELFANDACVDWECTPIPKKPGDPVLTPDDADSGCRIKVNYTKNCEERLGKRKACFEIRCDGSSLECEAMEFDTCRYQNTACMTYACTELENGEYGCVGTETPHAANTSCTEWVCNDKTGWNVYIERTPKYCEDKFKQKVRGEGGVPEEEVKCKNFYCNPMENGDIDGGCYYEHRQGCDTRCENSDEAKCLKDVASESSNSYCIYDYCVIVEEEGGDYHASCARLNDTLPKKAVNCLDPESDNAKLVEQLNNGTNKQLEDEEYDIESIKCYTPICDTLLGTCSYEEVPLPTDKRGDNCTKPFCVRQADGSWDWELVPTKTFLTCKTDACYIRKCVPDQGCVPTENCSRYSNECYSYSCVKDNENKLICNETDLTKNFEHLECMDEICVNGSKKRNYSPCVSENKCLVGTCVKGYCVFTDKTPEENDICNTYTCDNTTGKFTATPKCDDGLFCTLDRCVNYGTSYQCQHVNIECSSRINMTGYDCFMPYCKENAQAGDFRCIRKLRPNSYIDICGKCLKDNPDDVFSDSQPTNDTFTSCTDAPPEPLTYESLAAATIALIILGAIIAGGAVATTGVAGTKALISRARETKGLAAQSNPLFEGAETEMSNPGYAGGN